MSTEVKRVWGKADNLSLEFMHVGGDDWLTRVPPETKDGIYACELWAINSIGELGHWTGELYMCSGVCCVRIFSKPYQIWFRTAKRKVVIRPRHRIVFERRCAHVR